MTEQHAPLLSLAGTDDWQPSLIWLDGQLQEWSSATVHVNAVGHASVAAVFEGLKAYVGDGGDRLLVFRLDDHIRRLYDSARIARLQLPFEPGQLVDAVLELLSATGVAGDMYVRPWAFPKGLIREQMVPAGASCRVAIDCWPFTASLDQETGVDAAVSSWQRISDASMPPRVKAFSNYHNGRLAVMEARANGHDWPVLLNDRHKVAEGPGACIALVRDGVLITPNLSSGVLDGLTRDTVLRLAGDDGLSVEVREVDRSELYLADEIFFLGTAWEILPVITIDGLRVGEGKRGPVATRLSGQYEDVVHGRNEAYADWVTPVEL